MTSSTLPVHRTTIGFLAVVCLVSAAGLFLAGGSLPDNSSVVFLQGGLARVGMVLGALWFALPSRTQAAAWANLSPWTIAGLALAAIATTRIQLRVLLPAAVMLGILIVILRPKPKKRPQAAYERVRGS